MGMGDLLIASLAIAYMAAPLGFAVYVEWNTAQFYKIAFGRYKRIALYMRITAWLVYSYYVLVMAGGFVSGVLADMMVWPFTSDAAWIYLRLSVAMISYLFFSLMARELFRITRPDAPSKPTPEASTA